MKVKIVGASNFINRMYESCGPFQWAREFLKNSLEAGATRVDFGIEWQAVEKMGIYQRTIIDDGVGMTKDELLGFFSTLGMGAKKIGGVHDNFGVGAKIASLPWNPDGVVVISRKDGKCAMIKIVLDHSTGDYELVEFQDGTSFSCVVDPTKIQWIDSEIDYGSITPEWAMAHGTTIVLLGSKSHRDTILGNGDQSEAGTHSLSNYLNTRFCDLSMVKVRVVHPTSVQKSAWPRNKSEYEGVKSRTIFGASHYIRFKKTDDGQLGAEGTLLLDKARVPAHWYLWEGARPEVHSFAKEGGFIAVKYKDELFQLTQSKAVFRAFGIIETKIQKNLTIILEPKHYIPTNGRWGIHPDQSRNRLTFTGNGEKGTELPIYDWGQEFSTNVPKEIMAAIAKIREQMGGSIEDESYKNRLQDKFGDRWNTPIMKVDLAKLSQLSGSAISPNAPQNHTDDIEKPALKTKKPMDITKMVVQAKELPTGAQRVKEEKRHSDVPSYRYCKKEEFEKPWHVAIWAPNDPKGPTVLINSESMVILDAIKHHVDQYPPVHSEEIQSIVLGVYGEVAVSKVAHSEKLKKLIAKEVIDSDYRNEQCLTIAMMGFLAEDSVISYRLNAKFGRKKNLSLVSNADESGVPTVSIN